MANTYNLISKSILTSGQSSVSFTNLGSYSSTYTDLKVVASIRSDNNVDYLSMQFNGSGSSFSQVNLEGYGTGIDSRFRSDAVFSAGIVASTDTSDVFSYFEVYVPNFSSSNAKGFIIEANTENNGQVARQYPANGLWNNTAAITSITFNHPNSNFATNSAFYLYGISKS